MAAGSLQFSEQLATITFALIVPGTISGILTSMFDPQKTVIEDEGVHSVENEVRTIAVASFIALAVSFLIVAAFIFPGHHAASISCGIIHSFVSVLALIMWGFNAQFFLYKLVDLHEMSSSISKKRK